MTDAICAAVFGRRGCGKTTLVQRLARSARRVIVFDPTGEYSRALAWAAAHTLADVHRHLRQHWRHGFKIALTPSPGGATDPQTELHRLSRYIWEAQQPYEGGRDGRQILLVVEEMNLSVPNHALAHDLRGFLGLVLQGRHRGVGIIGVTQRPALVATDFRSMVAETYVFGLGYDGDAKLWGARWKETILTLPPHRYIHFAEGLVRTGQNPPMRHAAPAVLTR